MWHQFLSNSIIVVTFIFFTTASKVTFEAGGERPIRKISHIPQAVLSPNASTKVLVKALHRQQWYFDRTEPNRLLRFLTFIVDHYRVLLGKQQTPFGEEINWPYILKVAHKTKMLNTTKIGAEYQTDKWPLDFELFRTQNDYIKEYGNQQTPVELLRRFYHLYGRELFDGKVIDFTRDGAYLEAKKSALTGFESLLQRVDVAKNGVSAVQAGGSKEEVREVLRYAYVEIELIFFAVKHIENGRKRLLEGLHHQDSFYETVYQSAYAKNRYAFRRYFLVGLLFQIAADAKMTKQLCGVDFVGAFKELDVPTKGDKSVEWTKTCRQLAKEVGNESKFTIWEASWSEVLQPEKNPFWIDYALLSVCLSVHGTARPSVQLITTNWVLNQLVGLLLNSKQPKGLGGFNAKKRLKANDDLEKLQQYWSRLYRMELLRIVFARGLLLENGTAAGSEDSSIEKSRNWKKNTWICLGSVLTSPALVGSLLYVGYRQGWWWWWKSELPNATMLPEDEFNQTVEIYTIDGSKFMATTFESASSGAVIALVIGLLVGVILLLGIAIVVYCKYFLRGTETETDGQTAPTSSPKGYRKAKYMKK